MVTAATAARASLLGTTAALLILSRAAWATLATALLPAVLTGSLEILSRPLLITGLLALRSTLLWARLLRALLLRRWLARDDSLRCSWRRNALLLGLRRRLGCRSRTVIAPCGSAQIAEAT